MATPTPLDALDVQIVSYRPEHRQAFDQLNRRWLEEFGLLEAPDERDLTDPEGEFLADGGAIFAAEIAGRVVGVCGLKRSDETTFEIAKLGVDPAMQRRGIARRLLERCISTARARGARRIVLISNSQLTPAIALYEAFGFIHEPVPRDYADDYKTADVYMTLQLNEPVSITTTRTVLAGTPAMLDAWLRPLPSHLATANEGTDTWSPFDVMGHLIHGEKTDWMPRVRMILEHGEGRAFEKFDRFAQFRDSAGKSLPELLDEFAALRRANLDALAALNLTDADLDRRGLHPALGTVTLRQLLSTWVAHDLDHIYQVARVLAHQYRDEVGPWRAYLRVISGVASQP